MSNKKDDLEAQLEEWNRQVEEGEQPPVKDILTAFRRMKYEHERYPWHVHARQILGLFLLVAHVYFLYLVFDSSYKWMVGAYVFPMVLLLFDYVRMLRVKGVTK